MPQDWESRLAAAEAENARLRKQLEVAAEKQAKIEAKLKAVEIWGVEKSLRQAADDDLIFGDQEERTGAWMRVLEVSAEHLKQHGNTLGQANLSQRFGLNCVGIQVQGAELETSMQQNTEIGVGAKLLVHPQGDVIVADLSTITWCKAANGEGKESGRFKTSGPMAQIEPHLHVPSDKKCAYATSGEEGTPKRIGSDAKVLDCGTSSTYQQEQQEERPIVIFTVQTQQTAGELRFSEKALHGLMEFLRCNVGDVGKHVRQGWMHVKRRKVPKDWHGQNLKQLDLRAKHGITLCGILRKAPAGSNPFEADEKYVIKIPSAEEPSFEREDLVYVTKDIFNKMEELYPE